MQVIGGSKKCEKDLQMCSNEFTIKVTELSKCYNIYSTPADRLKQATVPKVFSLFGKPAPMYYREFWALKKINLDVRKGETVGIIGRNGSGKSTLLQLICKTLSPTSGEVETKGRITALLELGTGFNPEFTGRENIFLNGAILGLSQEEVVARFDMIVEFADIGEFIEQPVKFYSSGMTVRLAFAVQAMIDPDILIVDEALAVGDEMFQRKCFRRINELKEKGASILFVSHSGLQIIELCDRALLLEKGQRILFSDPVTTVRAYQEIMFSNINEQTLLIEKFKELDKGIQNTKNNVDNISLNEQTFPILQNNDIPEEDFFDSGMLPSTTVIHPNQGARICSVKILNTDGREVNNLLNEREYNLEISIEFLKDFHAASLKTVIQTKNGLPVSGIIYPGINKYINDIKSGQKLCFTVRLKMSLLPGTYFISASIWSAIEETPLHRVVDIIMFRVLPKKNNRAFGYVDLILDEPEIKIIEE